MEIVKVIVKGELPNSCEDCSVIQWDRYCLNCWCGITKEDVEEYCDKSARPDWCPLEVEKL